MADIAQRTKPKELISLLLNNDNIRDKFIDNFNVEDLPEIISDKD